MDGFQLILMILCLFGVVGWYIAGEIRGAADKRAPSSEKTGAAPSYNPRRKGFAEKAREGFARKGDANSDKVS
jgi:hypothetical protein